VRGLLAFRTRPQVQKALDKIGFSGGGNSLQAPRKIEAIAALYSASTSTSLNLIFA
jgi:hypothetical protein